MVAGASAIDLKRGLDRAARVAVEALRGIAKPVSSSREKAQIATISAHGDASIGELVAEALEKVGGEGIVTVEEAKGTETTLEIVEGMQIDRGYLSPYFVTDAEKMEAVLENPVILLHDKRMSSMKDLLPLLEQVAREGKALLVVAEDVEGEALATLVVNKLRGTLPCAAVKAPGFGDRRKAMLAGHGDPHRRPGARGRARREAREGHARRARHRQEGGRSRRTTPRSSRAAATRRAIEARCDEIRRQIEDTTSDYDREKLEERLAKLAGGVALIRVGAPSEAEMKNRKDAFDDAIASTKAAIAEGIVPGGGLALLRAIGAVAERGGEVRGRRGDRRAHPAPRARGARAPDRDQLGRRPGRGRRPDARGQRHARLRRRARNLRGPDRGRASSTRPRSCAWRSRTRCRWRACCCSPRRRSPRSRRSTRSARHPIWADQPRIARLGAISGDAGDFGARRSRSATRGSTSSPPGTRQEANITLLMSRCPQTSSVTVARKPSPSRTSASPWAVAALTSDSRRCRAGSRRSPTSSATSRALPGPRLHPDLPRPQQQRLGVAQVDELVQEPEQQQLEVRLRPARRAAAPPRRASRAARRWRRAAPRPRRRRPRAAWSPRADEAEVARDVLEELERRRRRAHPFTFATGTRCATRRERPACSVAAATSSTLL